MKTLYLQCASCNHCFTRALDAPALALACPACGAVVEVSVFNALLRPTAPTRHGETVMLDGESSCFYHGAKKAVVACDTCGRFLCALCDVSISGSHLCASCVESAVRETNKPTASARFAKERRFKRDYTHYDEIALTLAVISLLFYFSLVTLPISVYYTVRYWKQPLSAVPRGKWRFLLAILFQILALAELLFIGGVIVWGILK